MKHIFRQQSILAGAIVGILAWMPPTGAIAQAIPYIKVCKATDVSRPVSGSFTFTIDEVTPTVPPTGPRIVAVPVGGCSGNIGVAVAAQIRVSEHPRNNTFPISITATGTGSLVSANLATRTAIVMSQPFTTVVTFVNRGRFIQTSKPLPVGQPPKVPKVHLEEHNPTK